MYTGTAGIFIIPKMTTNAQTTATLWFIVRFKLFISTEFKSFDILLVKVKRTVFTLFH